ncbi:MAG: flagellar hook-associated protein FlgK [Betaproteobacteria bacterium]|nr:flagellar hook-associated protein FlgK [Betaproteobacteria bacterium]NCP82074.1 flagellar hook-associated protein FlgK [Rhodoferax sp.]OIP22063.1 MAG: flagellar hook-associated protein FlgK [Comamonadaceae bacterium CG2_30_57_122]PIZ23973.1 MAG: flagellar hook-associated protein FlgK [Comamonadaceae bacterium CG_4_10_14_0_8_um_filter_57_29]PJC14183.1 MAG: flagellar hook-associated protein FlgK [Comamonadaceae bacterium CG_4_9_14_0_8_um_filter_57_21]
MSILNVGTRALLANQVVLQTTGNNIANVNTPGYSRQTAVLQAVQGQFTGSGYVGKGVEVSTIQRNYSEFLTRQAALASATSSGDSTRADKLKQLEELFPGGATGLGAAINDMLNAFSDVASAPTDLTARTVALTRVSETAARMRSTSTNLDDLQTGVAQEIEQKVDAINGLTRNIAAINDKIARAQGSGQPPNDMLDQRDQLVRDLNRFVQTSSIPASDGTVGIFVGGSQALVLGTSAATLKVVNDDFNDPLKSKIAITFSGRNVTLDENRLGGGEVAGLLRFQNNDLSEGRNLLGRMTLAISTSMNAQHQLGLDLDGNAGGNLFTPTVFGAGNIMEPAAPAALNTGSAVLGLAISDVTQFAASNYEVNFSAAATGSITRTSDGKVTAFAAVPVTIDGLTLSVTAGSANAGDRFLLKPFSTSASNISAEFSSPRALAVASPVSGLMGSANTGSLQLATLAARTNPPTNVPVTISFTGANSYTRSDTGVTVYTYTSGQSIEGTVPATTPLSQWSLTLQGVPKTGDTFTVQAQPAAFRNLNAGNASAMMSLRDAAMFDGSALTDGYASLISQIGIRAQSANYASDVSSTIAANLEKDRTGVSGVNLDEEASKLLQYQQAYQASAKMIQVANSIFDTLLQTIG